MSVRTRSGLGRILGGLLCGCAVAAAGGQSTPTLVGDSTQTRVFSASHALRTAPVAPGRSILIARDTDAGDPLLVTDGTSAGTVPIAPGVFGPHRPITGKPLPIGEGLVLFRSTDDPLNETLWRTDGTTGGTAAIATFTGSNTTRPRLFTPSAGGYVFVATNATGRTELWFTDGTASGTRVTADITPPTGVRPGLRIVTVDRGLVLVDSEAQQVLVGDADGSGTAAVQFPAGQGFEDVIGAARVNGRTVFTTRVALWSIESGATTAVRLQTFDFSPIGSIVPTGSVAVYSTRRVATNDRLWRTDGTAAGTVPVRGESNPNVIYQLIPFQGRAAFVRYGGQGETPRTLGVTDGTNVGTTIFSLPLTPARASSAFALRVASGRVWAWSERDGLPNESLNVYSSDGTDAGTAQVLALGGGEQQLLRSLQDAPGGAMFTRWSRGIDGGVTHEIIASDGTAAGTRTVRTLTNTSLAPSSFTVPIGRLGTGPDAPVMLASSADNAGSEPWVTDLTVSGTRPVADLNTETDASEFEPIAANDNGVVLARRLPGRVVEVYSLRNQQLTFVRSFNNAAIVDRQRSATPLARLGFVQVSTSPSSSQLWATDGSSPGTRPIFLESPRSTAQFIGDVPGGSVLQLLLFGQNRILLTDGTDTGTSAFPFARPGFSNAVRLGDRLVLANFAGSALELVVTDGTPEGTGVLINTPVSGSTVTVPIAAVGDRLYVTSRFAGIPGLARVDGTPATLTTISTRPVVAGVALGESLIAILDAPGGRQLVRVNADDTIETLLGPTPFVPSDLVSVGDRVVVVAVQPDQSSVLFVSDGTVAGTTPINVGIGLSAPSGLTVIGRKVYFTAGAAGYGREPWVLDVDRLTIRRIADLRAGPGDSSPDWFVPTDQRMYFSAAGDGVGTELWSVPACDGDFNASGATEVQDVFDFLSAWFARTPRADTNADADVSVQDLFDFLARWTEGC